MATSLFNLRKLILLPGSLLLSISQIALTQQACQYSQPLTYAVVHEQPISINTDVLTNTTFFPFTGIGVTVNNAPTSLNGITTFHWTETKTYTDYSRLTRTLTATSATPTVVDDTFVMIVLGSRRHEKRQSGSYWVSRVPMVFNVP